KLDSTARRAAGRGPAYDRRFFEAILAARPALPAGTRGGGLPAPRFPGWGGGGPADLELAPLPGVMAPETLRPGWVALSYGPRPPGRWRVIRDLPGGALLAPEP